MKVFTRIIERFFDWLPGPMLGVLVLVGCIGISYVAHGVNVAFAATPSPGIATEHIVQRFHQLQQEQRKIENEQAAFDARLHYVEFILRSFGFHCNPTGTVCAMGPDSQKGPTGKK